MSAKKAELLNKQLDDLVHFHGGKYVPKVCFCCDCLLSDDNQNTLSVDKIKKTFSFLK